MRPLGFVGPTFPPEVNERLQYEVLLPFMLHIIYDAFGREAEVHADYTTAPLLTYTGRPVTHFSHSANGCT